MSKNYEFNDEILKVSSNYNKIFSKYLDELNKYIKNKNKSLSWSLPIIKSIKSNINIILIFFTIISLYYSNYFIKLLESFILFDSIILSILVLQSSKNFFNSRRLAKNVISMFILSINIIGSLFSILTVILIYFGFNKFISKTIFKFVEIFINFIKSTIPIISDLYPTIKMIDHNKPIESTELDISDNESESEIPNLKKNKNNKEYKFYKKLMEDIKTDK